MGANINTIVSKYSLSASEMYPSHLERKRKREKEDS